MLRILSAFTLLLFLIVIFFFRGEKKVTVDENPVIELQNLIEIPPLPSTDNYGFLEGDFEIIDDRIKRNESLYIILNRHGVSPLTIHNIQQEARGKVSLNRMVPGQRYRIYKSGDQALAFVWQRSATDFTTIEWKGDITIENGSMPIQTDISSVSGTIRSSLANAIASKGVSQRLVVELANIYAWTVDFYGLRTGDNFKAVYENRYVNDEFIGIGRVKAAEFQHRGRNLRAYYFHNGEESGYYDEEGNSVRRQLMRVPFDYNPRISSGFSHNRMHPILNQRRPHYGTDYAAPTGTPILAAGDGVITEAQRRGGNGNIVQIRHNSVYRTAYLHLSRFASGIRPGVNVRQGQVIGYVGQTGLATGPHLCYRFYKNDQPVNSVTYDFPASEGLSEKHMDQFMAEVDRLNKMLDNLSDSAELALY